MIHIYIYLCLYILFIIFYIYSYSYIYSYLFTYIYTRVCTCYVVIKKLGAPNGPYLRPRLPRSMHGDASSSSFILHCWAIAMSCFGWSSPAHPSTYVQLVRWSKSARVVSVLPMMPVRSRGTFKTFTYIFQGVWSFYILKSSVPSHGLERIHSILLQRLLDVPPWIIGWIEPVAGNDYQAQEISSRTEAGSGHYILKAWSVYVFVCFILIYIYIALHTRMKLLLNIYIVWLQPWHCIHISIKAQYTTMVSHRYVVRSRWTCQQENRCYMVLPSWSCLQRCQSSIITATGSTCTLPGSRQWLHMLHCCLLPLWARELSQLRYWRTKTKHL